MRIAHLTLVTRVGLTAGIIAVVASCSTAPPPLATELPTGSPRHVVSERDRPCTVAVVGDSLAVGITLLARPTQLFAERGCTLLMTDAVMGRKVAAGADVVETWQRLGVLPEVLVVMLGTNDCDGPSMRRGVQRILTAAGPDRPIVWQNTFRDGCDAAVNEALLDLRAEEMASTGTCRLWVIDHHAEVLREPTLVYDGLHLTDDAYRQRARDLVELIAPRAVATPCDQTVTPPPTDSAPDTSRI